MILLEGHSLAQGRRVPCESLGLSLKERESTETMVPADMTGITIDSWLQDDTEPGKGIVYRVKSIQTVYATDTPTVTLEHVISTLQDRILFGEVTAATISGGETCTAEAAIRYILSQQSDWILGTFSYGGVSGAYKFDGDSLYDALERVCTTLDECWWSYDFTRYPFRLNITQKPSGVACELRPGRNLATVTKTIDRSRMYTRFYPVGKNDLHVSGDYVSRNESKYGVISHVEVDQSRETEAELRAWANERLKKHAEPAVNIQAEGLELADATGETIDRLTLGRICRIPLQDFGTTIEERIIELNYRDKQNDPENVRVTMANQHEDLARIVAQAIKEGGGPNGSGRSGGGRGGAKKAKEDHAWFEDTDHHVAMCAEGIVGVDAEGNPNWTRLSQIIVDENGIHNTVQGIQNDLVIAETRIEQNENAITIEAARAKGEEGKLSASIKVEADKITTEVNERKNQYSSLNSRITQQANKISLVVEERGGRYVVNTAKIVGGINSDHGSYVKIQADTINLTGYVTMSDLTATNGRIASLISGQTTFDSLVATSASLGGSGGGNVRIYGQTVRIYTVKDTNNTTRYVYGYA